jgi:aspartyl-tRNA synthetase
MRSHGCGDLRPDATGQAVQLCGWVDRSRDHGGVIFIDLRDRSGTVQITVDPDNGAAMFAVAEHLRNETVIQVDGTVRERPADAINDKLATGRVEVLASAITVLNGVKGNLPFPVSVHDEENTREELRLRHRYLDLRRERRPSRPRAASWKTRASSRWRPRCSPAPPPKAPAITSCPLGCAAASGLPCPNRPSCSSSC